MTRYVAMGRAPHRSRDNAIGWRCGMSATLRSSMIANSEWRDEIEEKTPWGRVAGPSELVDAVQFLASDASAFMTGEIVTVDGGRSLLDSVSAPAH